MFVVWIVLFLQPETCPLCYSHLSLNFSFCVQDAVFFSCGDSLSSKGMTYLTNSLFDYRSPENNGVRAEFILDAANHKVTITRSLCYFTPKYYPLPNRKKPKVEITPFFWNRWTKCSSRLCVSHCDPQKTSTLLTVNSKTSIAIKYLTKCNMVGTKLSDLCWSFTQF